MTPKGFNLVCTCGKLRTPIFSGEPGIPYWKCSNDQCYNHYLLSNVGRTACVSSKHISCYDIDVHNILKEPDPRW